MIKAIETVYNGYRFRSRLEARWAVFFDALGIVWEYESEGYDLGGAGWYLPDFYFPGGLINKELKYAEVKPFQGKQSFSIPEIFPKLHSFAKAINTKVALLDGSPDFTLYYVFHNDAFQDQDENELWGEDGMLFSEAIGENRWFVFAGAWREDSEILIPENFETKYQKAVYAARQARFEHGEKGGI